MYVYIYVCYIYMLYIYVCVRAFVIFLLLHTCRKETKHVI
jgi:hypothetical protein